MPPPSRQKRQALQAGAVSAQSRIELQLVADGNATPYACGQRRANALATQLTTEKQCKSNIQARLERVLCDKTNEQQQKNYHKRAAEKLRAKLGDLQQLESEAAEVSHNAALIEQKNTLIAHKDEQISVLRTEKHLLQVQLRRATQKLEAYIPEKTAARMVSESLVARFKSHGVVPETVRTAVRDLYCRYGVSYRNVYPTMCIVLETFGMSVEGSISHQFVALCIKEALVAGQLSVCQLIMDAKGTHQLLKGDISAVY